MVAQRRGTAANRAPRDAARHRMRALERALARLATRDAPEALLRQRAELVLAQVASIGVALLVANDAGRYVDANEAATILTGYSRTALLQLSVWDLTPTPRQRLGQRLWRDFLRRGRMRGRYQLRPKAGTVITAEYTAVAHVLPGVHVSALSTPALIQELAARSRAASQPSATRARVVSQRRSSRQTSR